MDKKYFKWIGGGLGWVVGGPIGAILGFALGSMAGQTSGITFGQQQQANPYSRRQTSTNDFVVSLLVLSAAVMKADGRVMKSELDYVKDFFVRQFGERKAGEQILLLREILKQPVNLREVCMQIRANMPHPMRLQLIHYIFGLAQADGAIDSRELGVIEEVARYLGISQKDFTSIRAMFGTDTKSAYAVLEIDENASEAEVKKAYRKMAVKYHPDKLSSLGDDIQKAAREKFIKVQEAYEIIKKQRNIK